MRVKEFLSKADQSLFDVLLKNAKPCNRIAGVEVPDVLMWKFCDVMEIDGTIPAFELVMKVIRFHFDVSESVVMKCRDKDFVSFLKHIQNEMDKVAKLNEQLKSEPDNDLISAGIERMNPYGSIGIYYSISKNPLEWDAISEVPFGKMYMKLMIDKIQSEVQARYSEIQLNKKR